VNFVVKYSASLLCFSEFGEVFSRVNRYFFNPEGMTGL
jgi:hypothetical protein